MPLTENICRSPYVFETNFHVFSSLGKPKSTSYTPWPHVITIAVVAVCIVVVMVVPLLLCKSKKCKKGKDRY